MWAFAMRRALIVTAAIAGFTLVLQVDHHIGRHVFVSVVLISVVGGWAAYRIQERRRARLVRRLRGT